MLLTPAFVRGARRLPGRLLTCRSASRTVPIPTRSCAPARELGRRDADRRRVDERRPRARRPRHPTAGRRALRLRRGARSRGCPDHRSGDRAPAVPRGVRRRHARRRSGISRTQRFELGILRTLADGARRGGRRDRRRGARVAPDADRSGAQRRARSGLRRRRPRARRRGSLGGRRSCCSRSPRSRRGVSLGGRSSRRWSRTPGAPPPRGAPRPAGRATDRGRRHALRARARPRLGRGADALGAARRSRPPAPRWSPPSSSRRTCSTSSTRPCSGARRGTSPPASRPTSASSRCSSTSRPTSRGCSRSKQAFVEDQLAASRVVDTWSVGASNVGRRWTGRRSRRSGVDPTRRRRPEGRRRSSAAHAATRWRSVATRWMCSASTSATACAPQGRDLRRRRRVGAAAVPDARRRRRGRAQPRCGAHARRRAVAQPRLPFALVPRPAAARA